jgi:hypothetical protein
MNQFPAIDPIPLPAPVWLFKVLHVVTLSLHFMTVWMFLGGLAFATLWSIMGRNRPEQQYSNAAAAIAKRLPIVMTFLINFGVPPLLFVQVLYGRAIYTSSVLMGAWWISIIGLLMACYWTLYRFADRATQGRRAWHLGLLALLLGVSISRLLSTDMTLMLRPETWSALYSASPHGTSLPEGDPTLNPRWILMLLLAVFVSGLWMIYLSGRKSFEVELKAFFLKTGALSAIGAAIPILLVAWWVFGSQPATVHNALAASSFYQMVGWLGAGVLMLCLAVSVFYWSRKTVSGLSSIVVAVLGLLLSLSWTTYRDGIRDITLASKGLDVWQSPVVTNWSVVAVFLVLFVAAIGVVGWLVSVMSKAKLIVEKVQA